MSKKLSPGEKARRAERRKARFALRKEAIRMLRRIARSMGWNGVLPTAKESRWWFLVAMEDQVRRIRTR